MTHILRQISQKAVLLSHRGASAHCLIIAEHAAFRNQRVNFPRVIIGHKAQTPCNTKSEGSIQSSGMH